jgi:hypothetical protein
MPPLSVPNWIRVSLYWPTRHLIWRQIRPLRMYQGLRCSDPKFIGTERMYIRCTSTDLVRSDGARRLLPAFIRASGQSVNRGKYSFFFDVLLPGAQQASFRWLYLGVVHLQVSDVSVQLQSSVPPTEIRVEHVPLDDNYAHSEIRAFKSDRMLTPKQVAGTVKKELRQIISDRARILLLPNAS